LRLVFLNSLSYKRRLFLALAPRDRAILLQAIALLPFVALGRQLLTPQQLKVALECLFPLLHSPSRAAPLGVQAANTSKLVQMAANGGLIRGNCLEESITLWIILRRHGICSTLKFGAFKSREGFQAHAWVEFDGIVLNDSPDVGMKFTVFTQWIE
jgi:hypothetical protein